jgi:ectoine hydroxylase
MSFFQLSDDQLEQFNRDGYLHVPALFDTNESKMLVEAAHGDDAVKGNAFGVDDRTGNPVKLTLWNHPGDDIYGVIGRCDRVVNAMEKLLDDEVYHYHSKMILKEPRVGGAWEWHQDYGYWYGNGCLYPDMASVIVAIDKATKENGCLQVLKGSHKLGRIEHGLHNGQTCADPERTDAAIERLELVYCNMEPGDGFFFHGLTLHRSDLNTSNDPRWSLICCYNTKHNDPYKESHHPGYTPLDRLPDTAVAQTGAKISSDSQQFLDPQEDKTTDGQRAEVQ